MIKKCFLLSALLALLGSTAWADNWSIPSNSKTGSVLEPKNQLGVSLGYRIDEESPSLNHPEVALSYYRFFVPSIAFKVEIGAQTGEPLRSNRTLQSSYQQIGIRLQKWDRRASLFAEFGVEHRRYTGYMQGWSIVDDRTGAVFSFGVSAALWESARLDIALIGRYNNISEEYLILGVPCSPEYPCGSRRPTEGPDSLYNPLGVRVSYRFGI